MTAVKLIDAAQASKLLVEARDRKGADHVYQGVTTSRGGKLCSYVEVEDGTFVAGCIVGNILVHGLNIDPSEFIVGEMKDYNHGAGVYTLNGGLYRVGYQFTSDAADMLSIAQDEQDTGETWGHAVECALDNP